jgi:hypothetical protein
LLKVREVNVTNTIIKRLGVVVNADKGFDFEQFYAFATKINVHPNNIKIITFSEQKKDNLNAWDNCYYPNDFGWKGAINNVELKAFLDTKFDVLISYYEEDVLELKLITACSKAELKIGILQSDERLNDIIIKTKLKEFNIFEKELIKYLTILNKVKHE